MPRYDYDLITIGGGSGGVRASRVAASLGARVALFEEARLGGTCVNAGCIPKKLLSYASHYASHFADARGYGWEVGSPRFDWPRLIANKDREIERLNGVYARLLDAAGVKVMHARARVADPHTVEAEGRRMTAQHILIATGSRAILPKVPGSELAITSDEAFHLDRLPRRVIVAGAGYIALEFASIFAGLGAQVTLVHRGPQVLRSFDEELGNVLTGEMAEHGVAWRLNSRILAISQGQGGLDARLGDGSALSADTVMYAIGRKPNTRDMGLAEAGVALTESGAVKVDDFFGSSVTSIHAIGDVIDRIMLTPVAIAEGAALAKALFGGGPRRMDYEFVPTAVFSHPNAATVGLSEAGARAKRYAVRIFKTRFRPLRATLSGSTERVFMKLVVDGETDRVLGAHMVGDEAGEIIQAVAIALKCGATKSQFDATIGIHPTSAEEFVTMRESA